jgi:hypothetical protein
MAMAQKYVKLMQSGYAISIQMGSKLLMKCTTTESGFFNCKAFTKLDEIKVMEDGYKLDDTDSLTAHPAYANLRPIGIVAWAQKEQSKLVAEHEWPRATTLHFITVNRRGIFGPTLLSSSLEMVPSPRTYRIVGRTGRQLLMERKVPIFLLLPGKRFAPSISPRPLLMKKGKSGSFAQSVRIIQRRNSEFTISVILIQHMLRTFVPKPYLKRI